MTTYLALLRAVNVGGNSVVKMADVKAALESAGLSAVTTYIQSGNILFDSALPREQLPALIEGALLERLDCRTTVLVLTKEELKSAVRNNPFEPARRDAEQRCHLLFLASQPDQDNFAALKAMEGEEYSFAIGKKVLYFAYPRAYDGPKRRSINFEKVLGTWGTARTWRVAQKLCELMDVR